jgi:hypothetical protein
MDVDHIIIGARGIAAAHAARQRLFESCGRGRMQRHGGAATTAGVAAAAEAGTRDGKPNEMPSRLSSSEQYRIDTDANTMFDLLRRRLPRHLDGD